MKRLSVLQTLCRQDACVPDFIPDQAKEFYRYRE
jgi:hypothetical protein